MKKVEVIEVKRLGRPVKEDSERQQLLKALSIKRESGELKQGRPVNPDSVRQQRLKALESKKVDGVIPRGRPKKVEIEEEGV